MYLKLIGLIILWFYFMYFTTLHYYTTLPDSATYLTTDCVRKWETYDFLVHSVKSSWNLSWHVFYVCQRNIGRNVLLIYSKTCSRYTGIWSKTTYHKNLSEHTDIINFAIKVGNFIELPIFTTGTLANVLVFEVGGVWPTAG